MLLLGYRAGERDLWQRYDWTGRWELLDGFMENRRETRHEQYARDRNISFASD